MATAKLVSVLLKDLEAERAKSAALGIALDEARAALAAEKASDTITVWKDGTWKRWSMAAAVHAQDDPDWLSTIPVEESGSAGGGDAWRCDGQHVPAVHFNASRLTPEDQARLVEAIERDAGQLVVPQGLLHEHVPATCVSTVGLPWEATMQHVAVHAVAGFQMECDLPALEYYAHWRPGDIADGGNGSQWRVVAVEERLNGQRGKLVCVQAGNAAPASPSKDVCDHIGKPVKVELATEPICVCPHGHQGVHVAGCGWKAWKEGQG